MNPRERHLDMLKRVLATDANGVPAYELPEPTRTAFEDMLMRLTTPDPERRCAFSDRPAQNELTSAQEKWVANVLDKYEPQYQNLVSSGKVPRGREVPTPAVLLNRPLKPPKRK